MKFPSQKSRRNHEWTIWTSSSQHLGRENYQKKLNEHTENERYCDSLEQETVITPYYLMTDTLIETFDERFHQESSEPIEPMGHFLALNTCKCDYEIITIVFGIRLFNLSMEVATLLKHKDQPTSLPTWLYWLADATHNEVCCNFSLQFSVMVMISSGGGAFSKLMYVKVKVLLTINSLSSVEQELTDTVSVKRIHYDRYNQRYGKDGIHECLEWSEFDDDVASFKNKFIHPAIVETETEEKSEPPPQLSFPRYKGMLLHSTESADRGVQHQDPCILAQLVCCAISTQPAWRENVFSISLTRHWLSVLRLPLGQRCKMNEAKQRSNIFRVV
ncbi:hypothetical protein PR048_024662 [Dryococelus australis]|uniref:Uncharacterized protein n=1 Tax=Dryococelus australis TaxID=614101 RepID=A0ABQ9GP64_9NEOP|nr:hypothetical protein PR048_024662 [Dryococelus australis]